MPASVTKQRSTRALADGIGVNVRFDELMNAELSIAHKSRVRWLRTDVQWARIEIQPTVYDFGHYVSAFTSSRRAGFRILGILDYGHPIHTHGRAPSTEDERS